MVAHSFAKALLLTTLPVLSIAHGSPSKVCKAPVTITLTKTVDYSDPSDIPQHSYQSGGYVSNPHPVAKEHKSCFDRSKTEDVYYTPYPVETSSTVHVTESCTKTAHSESPTHGYFNASSSAIPYPSAMPKTNMTIGNFTKPPCIPTIELDGVAENVFNAKDQPFSIKITNCSPFSSKAPSIMSNFKQISGLQVTDGSIAVPAGAIADEYVVLSLFALDTNGYPIIKSWELHFGSVAMPVLILNPDDTPAAGVKVEANATIYPGLTATCTTDAAGKCSFQCLPGTTISLVARKDDNSIAVDGLAPSTVEISLKLLPFVAPASGSSFGSGLTGWTGGSLQQSVKVKRDTTLVVNTNGQFDLQSASSSFPASETTKKAYIKYRFITSEVPGGYFG